MSKRINRENIDGDRWLFSLTYGVEKRMAHDAVSKPKRSDPEVDLGKYDLYLDALRKSAFKLSNASYDAKCLEGIMVEVTELPVEEHESLTGVVEKVDLKKHTISIRSIGKLAHVSFCEVETADELETPKIIPTIALRIMNDVGGAEPATRVLN